MRDLEAVKNKLVNFLKMEAEGRGFKKAVIGISGGIDSALSSALASLAFEEVRGVLLPSKITSDKNIEDAKRHCEQFGVAWEIIPIHPMVEAYFHDKGEVHPMRIGNFSARMRMSVLYDVSFRENALVIGTSNKSEILLGYGTHHGDTACALNPIGQLYKTDVWALAAHMGIDEAIVNKKPSAELYHGQEDEKELGYTYKELDEAMVEMFDNGKSNEAMVVAGFKKDLVEFIRERNVKNSFKCELPAIGKL